MLRRAFPTVVDATLSQLKAIQDRFAGAGDAVTVDLHRRATNCIAAIEPYKVDLSTAGGMEPLPPALRTATTGGTAAGGTTRQEMPERRMDPGSCQPLMPNRSMKFPAASAAARTGYLADADNLAIARQTSDAEKLAMAAR